MTLFPKLNSHYGELAFFGVFFVSFVVSLVILAIALCVQRGMRPTRGARIAALILHAMSHLIWLFAWSSMQSIQVAPFPVTYLVGLVFTFPSAAVMALLATPRTANLMFRRAFGSWADAATKKDEDSRTPTGAQNSGSGGAGSAAEAFEVGRPREVEAKSTASTTADPDSVDLKIREGSDTELVAKAADVDNYSQEELIRTEGTTVDPETSCFCGAIPGSALPPVSSYKTALRQNIIIFAGFVAVFAIANFIMTILMYGGCACLQPMEYTTWAGRRSQDRVCAKEGPCHAYFLVSQNCTMVSAVAHVLGTRPQNSTVTVCAGTASGYADCVPVPTSRTRTAMLAHPVVPGDTRFLLHVSTGGLAGDSIYTFLFAFDDWPVVVRSVRTMPCGAASDVVFIGGGDYHTSDIGARLLANGIARAGPEVRFVYLGGDLSYSNNLPFCFERVDKFLAAVTRLRRPADGTTLPALVAIGNHEAGGRYDTWQSRTLRETQFYFHPYHFPSFADSVGPGPYGTFYQDDDWTTTYHRHITGPTAWIVLDSGIIFSVDKQLAWLRDSLAYYESLISAGQLRKIIVTYHNPAYPSVRATTDTQAVAMRNKVVPILDEHFPRVSWVLENHDHAYKRTFPLLNNTAIPRSNSSVPGGGIIYSGDGALGVADLTRSVKLRWYHEFSERGNYILAATLLGSGDPLSRTARVLAVDENNHVVDQFYV